MAKYNVKFFVKAIVELSVEAKSSEEAIEKARKKMNKLQTFSQELSYLAGKEIMIGYGLQDALDEIYS